MLDNYLSDAVGIGEHSDIPAEINKWVAELASAEDALCVLQRYQGI